MKIRLAGCIIRNSEGKILLLHRNTSKRNQWEIPGGKIDKGENPQQTAKREVKEELNIDVEIVRKIGEKEFFEDGFAMDYIWFNAKIISGEPKLIEGNFDEFKYFSLVELRTMENKLSPNARNFVQENPK